MGLRDTHLAPNAIGGFGGCWSLHLREMQEKDHGDRLFGQPIVQTNRNRKS